MKEIGGFFELELKGGKHYHQKALKLNSARNCFKYILKAKKITKVWLPAYCCDSLIEPLTLSGIDYEFYSIDEIFESIAPLPILKKKERFLYINYFGLKSEYISLLVKFFQKQLIVDNTQAFFDQPYEGIDTFYSPRKFFGVADGGYLFTDTLLEGELPYDKTGDLQHLIGRHESPANSVYAEYQKSEIQLINQPIRRMSKFTQAILESLDYEAMAFIRQRNFYYLHSKLESLNKIKITLMPDTIPMIYPYLTDCSNLKQKCIKNKIYVATYWPEALSRIDYLVERTFVQNLLPLPIDQRYDLNDMDRIYRVIE